jgi:pentose-5-phosphate-3-epimerase
MTMVTGMQLTGLAADVIRKNHMMRCDNTREFCPAIERDAGQSCENAGPAIEESANAIVAGSVIFGATDYTAAIAAIRESDRSSAGEACL